VFRRLVADSEWHFVAGLLVLEIVLGITGYYAGFREPLIMAALAFLEFFDRRNVRQWITITLLMVFMAVLGIAWMGVRVEYRARFTTDEKFDSNRSARIDLLRASMADWAGQSRSEMFRNIDAFVERMWTIYYPALAVSRVPSVLPHTNGQLMAESLQYVFEPRLFFPDKPDIKSDSEMVRKYSGVWVAGEDQLTDIAFGYAAESYIDFGIPMMFVPMFVWSAFIGLAIASILRVFRHRDIAVAVSTVIAWLSLYLFERSWAKTIGLTGTLLIYAGGLCYLLDLLWFQKFRNVYVSDLSEASDSLAETPLQQLPAGSK
jgi:thiamine transporter ThiT